MRKKIIFIFAVAAFAGTLAFNSFTNSSKATVSTVTLANIEALTKGEITICACPSDYYYNCFDSPAPGFIADCI